MAAQEAGKKTRGRKPLSATRDDPGDVVQTELLAVSNQTLAEMYDSHSRIEPDFFERHKLCDQTEVTKILDKALHVSESYPLGVLKGSTIRSAIHC